MESKMQIFDSAQFGRIRTFDVKGNPWFVGRDVAVALGYKETAKAVREKVDIEDKGVSEIDTPGGKQQITIINESGLYSLIMSSKLYLENPLWVRGRRQGRTGTDRKKRNPLHIARPDAFCGRAAKGIQF